MLKLVYSLSQIQPFIKNENIPYNKSRHFGDLQFLKHVIYSIPYWGREGRRERGGGGEGRGGIF